MPCVYVCVYVCVLYIYTTRSIYDDHSSSSILYSLSSILASPRRCAHPSIHPSIIAFARCQSTFGRLAPCPTDHLLPSTVHTHAYTYIHRREYVCEYDRWYAHKSDGRATEGSVAPPLVRASLGRPSHRHTDARRRRRRDVFHHGSRDVPPHDDDDDDDALDDDTSTTGDDRARRRCEQR